MHHEDDSSDEEEECGVVTRKFLPITTVYSNYNMYCTVSVPHNIILYCDGCCDDLMNWHCEYLIVK